MAESHLASSETVRIGNANMESKSSELHLTTNRDMDATEVVNLEAEAKESERTPEDGLTDGDCDPWALPALEDDSLAWKDLTVKAKIIRVLSGLIKGVCLLILLYFFVVSLDFLGSALRLVAGKEAGRVLSKAELLENPIVGLMLGVICTAVIQSSSSTTSIVITMVGARLLDVHDAIPIIMGANIGTSVTNTVVSLGQLNVRSQFRRAFAAAVVHDMFNWLTVFILLPVEVCTGYLEKVTGAIMDSTSWQQNKNLTQAFLTVLTKPFTRLVIQLDKKVLEGHAVNSTAYENASLLKTCCIVQEESVLCSKCGYLMEYFELDDRGTGVFLLVVSVILLAFCLYSVSKLLNSVLKGRISLTIRKMTNTQLRTPYNCILGYGSIIFGCCVTILVQSSSIFTSALTPLAGLGVITIESIYPLTLGSNIGTTTTGILAALAVEPSSMRNTLQIAFCHLFFNITGILMFYPIAFMRFPVPLAKFLGNITADYRWFAIFYVIIIFFLLPIAVFALSLAGATVFIAVAAIILSFVAIIVVLNVLQRKRRSMLPKLLQTWEFLPLWMHSLDPLDKLITRALYIIPCCRCSSICKSSKNQELNFGVKPQSSEVNILQPAPESGGGIENASFDWRPASENTKL